MTVSCETIMFKMVVYEFWERSVIKKFDAIETTIWNNTFIV